MSEKGATVDGVRRVLGQDYRSGMRAAGGLLLAVGTLVLLFRRTSFADPWGDFVVFLILAALTKFLYWTGFLGARWGGRTLPWQTVFIVFAVLLTPVTLFTFVNWVGGDTGAPLNVAWIFLLTAVAALIALFGARVRVGALLGGLALIVSWLGLWDELLDQGLAGHMGTVRWLLFVIAAILLALALMVSISSAPDGAGSDVVTAAGIAAVAAGSVSFIALQGFISAPVVPGVEATAGPPGGPSLFWDIELLVASMALLGFGASAALSRGPAYVGAFGLAAFIFSVGLDLDDSSPAGKVLGWPLILLLIGAVLFLASVVPALRRKPA
jgi:hypothetical protein